MDLNQLEKALAEIGVDLKDKKGNYKSIDQLLIKVANKWNKANRKQRRAVYKAVLGQIK